MCKVDKLDTQNKTKKECCNQQLLKDSQLAPKILASCIRAHFSQINQIDYFDHLSYKNVGSLELNAISNSWDLIIYILQANRDQKSLQLLHLQALKSDSTLELRNELLLYYRRLIVPDISNLRILFIREVYDIVSIAHPDIKKTLLLLSNQYY
jgi:hypothetical protein